MSYSSSCFFARKQDVTWLGCDETDTPSKDGQRLETSHFIRESGCRGSRPLIRVNVVVVRRVEEAEKLCGRWWEKLELTNRRGRDRSEVGHTSLVWSRDVIGADEGACRCRCRLKGMGTST